MKLRQVITAHVLPAALLLAALVLPVAAEPAAPALLPQGWDYTKAMKKLVAQGKEAGAKEGVVLHIGDSITYANPYGQWARYGKGKTAKDKVILKWMHINANNNTDGWYLARVDRPGGRSDTAASGIRIDQMLKGGKAKMPPLKDILEKYKPQMVVFMLGTNDASANRKVDAYIADMTKSVDLMLSRGVVCILSTIPPHPKKLELAKQYNIALRKLAKKKSLPLIDFEREILKRRPKDWNGTLLGKDNVHPTSKSGNTKASDAPTAQNLRNSGYLLRGWLSVRKIAEVKQRVIDSD